MKKIFIAIIALLVVGTGAWYANYKGLLGRDSSNVIATVNGEEITQDDFDAFEQEFVAGQGVSTSTLDAETKAKIKTEVTEALISQALLSQAATNSTVEVSGEQAKTEMETVKGRFGSDAEFQQALVTQGITEIELLSRLEIELLIRAYLEDKLSLSTVTATETEIKTAYDQVAATQTVPPLTEVHDQVRDMILGQKKQALIAEHVAELRAQAEVELM